MKERSGRELTPAVRASTEVDILLLCHASLLVVAIVDRIVAQPCHC